MGAGRIELAWKEPQRATWFSAKADLKRLGLKTRLLFCSLYALPVILIYLAALFQHRALTYEPILIVLCDRDRLWVLVHSIPACTRMPRQVKFCENGIWWSQGTTKATWPYSVIRDCHISVLDTDERQYKLFTIRHIKGIARAFAMPANVAANRVAQTLAKHQIKAVRYDLAIAEDESPLHARGS